jgi:hypothetical protein
METDYFDEQTLEQTLLYQMPSGLLNPFGAAG